MTSTSTPIVDERLGLGRRVAVDADGDGDHQPPVGVDRRPVDRPAQRALAGDARRRAGRRRRRPGATERRSPTGARRSPRASVPSGDRSPARGSSTCCSCVNRSKPAASCSVNMPTGRPPSSTTTTAPCERLWIRPSASPTVCCGLSVIGVSYTVWRDLTYSIDRLDDVERDVLRQHRDARRGGPPSRPSAARPPRSCWRRRPGSCVPSRRAWSGRRRGGTAPPTGSAP